MMNDEYVLILDLERTVYTGLNHYWLRAERGYTTDKEKAGRFLCSDAIEICKNDIEDNTLILPIK